MRISAPQGCGRRTRRRRYRSRSSLAGLDDRGLEKTGIGARELQTRARQFLKPQSETELREEKASLKSLMKNLSIEVEHLREVVEGARSTQPSATARASGQRRRRGRPARLGTA